MKRVLLPVLLTGCLIFTFLLTACNKQGGGNTEEQPTAGLTYEKRGDSYAVTGMTGTETSVIIPSKYEGRSKLETTGYNAFSDNRSFRWHGRGVERYRKIDCAKSSTVHDGLGTKSTDAIDNYLRAYGLLA